MATDILNTAGMTKEMPKPISSTLICRMENDRTTRYINVGRIHFDLYYFARNFIING